MQIHSSHRHEGVINKNEKPLHRPGPRVQLSGKCNLDPKTTKEAVKDLPLPPPAMSTTLTQVTIHHDEEAHY